MNEPYICVIGASIIDLTGFSKNQLNENDYNLGVIKTSLGGVARNIAEILSRLDLKVKLITVIGDDHHGKLIMDLGNKSGIDLSHSLILKNKATALNMALLGSDNSLAMGFTDLTIMEKLSVDFIKTKKEIIGKAAIVVLETNLHVKVLQQIIKDNPYQKYVLDTASGPTALRAKNILSNLFILKTNELEAANLITDKETDGKNFGKTGAQHLFITGGNKSVKYFCHEKQHEYLPNKIKAVNTNGAGDAFLSGVIYGFIKKLIPEKWALLGLVLAEKTAQHQATVHPEINAHLLDKFLSGLK